ncbi:alpha-amylase family glycosyl hydrolase [Vallicoccus soli]|uniref:Alpha-amylase n=1 Tax=Vallicoccus soli TaxID=2339232 RepID=A0A3A3YX63_9ACTN|nr:alpha-amylase family glycosyl hydrolase [Vallicoccus soli]RJK94858.1 alpha-amylase [Vallicoccus soli]
MTSWHEHVMWWHAYPLGFTGAPVRPDADEATTVVHRLGRMEPWLDHLVGLGLNGLALGPVFASQTHGYDTVDHFRVDPRLGDEGDLDRLLGAAHARGVRVLLDGVFHHVGRAHPAFARVEAEGPDAPTAGWFDVDWDGWRPGDPVRARVFEGHEQLVALDHGAPEVADLVVRVMRHWLDRGADGWRLDAAYAVPPAFWARVLPEVRRTHPDAWFTGEVIHGDAAGIVRASTMDSLTQYELWQGIWHGIAERNFYELAHALERHDALLATFVPSTFVGNHDVTRIASAVGPDLVPHALAVLLTVAGVPSVYAGDEYAWTGVKEQRIGGDDAVRPEFPASPPDPGSLDPVARRTLRVHQELVALRRRNPWLVRARTDVVHLDNRSLVLRTATGSGAVVTALSLEDGPVALPAAGARSLAAGDGRLADGRVHLAPRGWAVLQG